MKSKKTRRVFSESFKIEKVHQLEHGQVTVGQLKKMYNVSATSIYRWKNKYGKLPATDLVVVEKDSEYLKVLSLQKKIEQMEKLIGRQQVLLDYYSGIIIEANSHYDDDIEKKFGQE